MIKLTEQQKSEIYSIMDMIHIPWDFGVGEGLEEDQDALDVFNHLLDVRPDLNLFHGISKAVIVSPTLSVVIKIPFRGEWFYAQDEDEQDVFEQFCGARANNGFDYCEDEISRYEDAADVGVQNFFAQTLLFDTINYETYEWPIYVQEKVQCQENIFLEKIPSAISRSKVLSWSAALEIRDTQPWRTWLANAIDFYGEERVGLFLSFLECNPEISSDLHWGNCGYRDDGSAVLIDYSGYRT